MSGSKLGFLVGLLVATLLFLGVAISIEGSVGEAAVAVGTLALAFSTIWLALEARSERAELREARFAEFSPMLRWQSPRASVEQWPPSPAPPQGFYIGLEVFLSNEAPGYARIREVEIAVDTGEDFGSHTLGVPSTMEPKQRVTFRASPPAGQLQAVQPGPRRFTIRIRYGDLLGEFEYETVAIIDVVFGIPNSTAQFHDSDERSVIERRVPRRSPTRR